MGKKKERFGKWEVGKSRDNVGLGDVGVKGKDREGDG